MSLGIEYERDRKRFVMKLIDRAKDEYASDDLEIDDDAGVSESDEGAWVQAWVWLRNSEEVQS